MTNPFRHRFRSPDGEGIWAFRSHRNRFMRPVRPSQPAPPRDPAADNPPIGTASTTEGTLEGVLPSARSSMLCFVLPDRLAKLMGGKRWKASHPLAVCLALALAMPAVSAVLLFTHLISGANCWNFTGWYVLYYFVLNLALLWIPRDAWDRLVGIAADVDAVIRADADRVKLATRVRRMIRLDAQCALGALGFGVGVVGAIATARARHVEIAAAIPFELSLGLTIALGANVVTWIASGMHWLYVFCQLPSVRYDSVDPLSSAGLRSIYRLLTRAQWYCTFGLVLALGPLAFLYSAARGSTFLRLRLVIAVGGSLLVVVLAYTVPPWLIHMTRVRDKRELLNELRGFLPPSVVGLSENELSSFARRLTLYEQVQARPTGRADRVLITSLLLSLATISAAFIPLLLHGVF